MCVCIIMYVYINICMHIKTTLYNIILIGYVKKIN